LVCVYQGSAGKNRLTFIGKFLVFWRRLGPSQGVGLHDKLKNRVETFKTELEPINRVGTQYIER